MLNLRDYQHGSLDALRAGFAQGKRAQILYAPTGAGKTEMAIALLDATKKKSNRAAMLLDRIILCDQTSQRLDHAAHRLRVTAHDFGVRADTLVAYVVYGLAGLGTLLTLIYLLRI